MRGRCGPTLSWPSTASATRAGGRPPSSPSAIAWVPQWASSTIVAHTVLDEVMTTSRATGSGRVGGAHPRPRPARPAGPRPSGERRPAPPVGRRATPAGHGRRRGPPAGRPARRRAHRRPGPADLGGRRRILDALRDAGSAVVVSTHDDAVVTRADRVTTLRRPPQPAPEPTPRRPLVARAGPLSLLPAAMLAVPAGIVSPRWQVASACWARRCSWPSWGSPRPARVPGRADDSGRCWSASRPGLVAAASVAWSTWLLGGHHLPTVATAALRVLIIVFPSAVLVPFIDADALGDHLAQRLRLPARPVVALSAALQRIHTFGEIWSEIARARRVRGLGASQRSPASLAREAWALTDRHAGAVAAGRGGARGGDGRAGLRHGIPAHLGRSRRRGAAPTPCSCSRPSCPSWWRCRAEALRRGGDRSKVTP